MYARIRARILLCSRMGYESVHVYVCVCVCIYARVALGYVTHGGGKKTATAAKERKGRREILSKRRLQPKDTAHRARFTCMQGALWRLSLSLPFSLSPFSLPLSLSLPCCNIAKLPSRTKEHDEREIEIVTKYERDLSTPSVDAERIFRGTITISKILLFAAIICSTSEEALCKFCADVSGRWFGETFG